MPGYQTDLAHIHDAGFGFIAENGARELVARLQRAGIQSGRVVELGCGSGISAAHLTQLGYGVDGIDLSPSMIRLARARVPQARFRRGSIVDSPIRACVAVTAFGEVLNYTFDGTRKDSVTVALFKRVFESLTPGGILLFDMATPDRIGPGEVVKNFTETETWACLYKATGSPNGQILTREITTFRKVGRTYRRHFETHRIRLLDANDLLARLRDIGFTVQKLSRYDAYRFPRGLVGIAARKPPR